MQFVTAVDGHWLAELRPMFFTVKESTSTRFVSLYRSLSLSLALSLSLSLKAQLYYRTGFMQYYFFFLPQKLDEMEAAMLAASEEMKTRQQEMNTERTKKMK